jgi:DNA-binding Lrp family transcriptional regulator
MLDKKDSKILIALKENAKLSTKQISRKTLIPITTVHHRIKKLEKEGIIKGYTTLLDNKKIGKELTAYVLITVDYNVLKNKKMSQHALAEKIRQNEYVEEVAMIAGGFDIIIKMSVSNIDEMDSFVTEYLRNIEGVEKTQTMVVLHNF